MLGCPALVDIRPAVMQVFAFDQRKLGFGPEDFLNIEISISNNSKQLKIESW